MIIPFLRRARSGEPASDERSRPDAFSELVKPHLAGLYRLAYRFTRHQQEAEDLLQELLTRLYARSQRLDEVESLRPWLARALYNLYVDERRRLARSPLGHLQPVADGRPEEEGYPAQADHRVDPDFCTEMHLVRSQLEQLVARLPEEQREVVILHDVEGYALHEAADILGVALGTVKSRLHRAHERLRQCLRQRNLFPSNVVLSDEGPGLEPGFSISRVSNDEM